MVSVGIDLFQLYDQHYLVTVNYFSNFFEVDKLSTTSATQVTTKFRIHFARFGVPDVVVSDIGPQFACEEFKQFATLWQFSHVTASPRYPQSNGKVENAVKTARQLMRKAIDDKEKVSKCIWHFWTIETHQQKQCTRRLLNGCSQDEPEHCYRCCEWYFGLSRQHNVRLLGS